MQRLPAIREAQMDLYSKDFRRRRDLPYPSSFLIRGDFALCHFRRTAGTIRRQPGITDLIEQGSVTNVQSSRRLLAVPVMIMQHSQDDLAFQGASRLASQFL